LIESSLWPRLKPLSLDSLDILNCANWAGIHRGELRNGDRPTGPEIARGLKHVCEALPPEVETISAHADSGFYSWDAVAAYEGHGVQFMISARKAGRLIEELKAAVWKPSPRTDADGSVSFPTSRCRSLLRYGLFRNFEAPHGRDPTGMQENMARREHVRVETQPALTSGASLY
jgi:hypothetical protein